MGKGKTFGGLGIGVVLSTIATVFIAKKKSNLLSSVQKNILSFSGILKSLSSYLSEQNKKEVT
jgi:gas vesicle protein